MVERALVCDGGGADEERREDDVAVPDDPTDVARRPPDVTLAKAKHPLRHRIDVDLITAVRVHRELRLGGGAARREDVRRLVRLELDVTLFVAGAGFEEVLPGDLVSDPIGRLRPPQCDDVLH